MYYIQNQNTHQSSAGTNKFVAECQRRIQEVICWQKVTTEYRHTFPSTMQTLPGDTQTGCCACLQRPRWRFAWWPARGRRSWGGDNLPGHLHSSLVSYGSTKPGERETKSTLLTVQTDNLPPSVSKWYYWWWRCREDNSTVEFHRTKPELIHSCVL